MTHSTIRPRAGILEISPYVGGASRIEGVRDVVKLSSNENPHGPSPAAIDAFRATADALHRYPSGDHAALRQAIAEVEGLDADNIVCGAGSDELIAHLCQAYSGPGDEVLHTRHGFAMYRISALAAGAIPVQAPEIDRRVDVDAVLAATGDATRLVFITNPANPAGTMIGATELQSLAEGLPAQALLVLDGAYAEFADDYDGGAKLVAARDNVVMTRTFSKLYGLGGLRIGWCYAPAHVVDVLNRVRGPFNLSETQQKTAEAAIRDRSYAQWCRGENARLREWLSHALAKQGIPSDPSQANFLLARFASEAEARSCEAHLRSCGLLVRDVTGYGFPEALRISIGDEEACRRVADAVKLWRAEAA